MREIRIYPERCMGCRSCAVACAVAHSASGTLLGAWAESLRGPGPQARITVTSDGTVTGLPVLGGAVNVPFNCRQCERPACVAACMTGAMAKDPQTGTVRCAAERCVGCWMCVQACPFGAVAPGNLGTALKCDRCDDRPEGPACVAACPVAALRFEDPEELLRQSRRRTAAALVQSRAAAQASERSVLA